MDLKRIFDNFFVSMFQGFIGWYMVSSGLIDKVDVSHYRLSLHLVTALMFIISFLEIYFKLKFKKKFNKTIKLNYFLNFFFY